MIQGKNIDKNVLSKCTDTFFDLSGSTENDVVWFNPLKSIRINSISIIYGEASSADAGTAINFGDLDSATTYGTTTSLVSKASGFITTIQGVNLTKSIVPAGKPLIIASAGSKVGTGTVAVSVNYTVL